MSDRPTPPASSAEEGLCCPNCGCPESEVAWTRRRVLTIGGKSIGAIVRARTCDHCGARFTTSERVSEG